MPGVSLRTSRNLIDATLEEIGPSLLAKKNYGLIILGCSLFETSGNAQDEILKVVSLAPVNPRKVVVFKASTKLENHRRKMARIAEPTKSTTCAFHVRIVAIILSPCNINLYIVQLTEAEMNRVQRQWRRTSRLASAMHVPVSAHGRPNC